MPMGAFSIDELNLLAYADIPQRILNLLPSFDENELPDTRYPEWDREIRAYWLESERTAGELMEATIAKIFEEERRQRADDPGAMLAERLLDYRVINPEGEDLGGVEDLMIHLETLEVVYPIITFGGFLGFGEKRFPVPVDMVEVVPPQEALVLNVDVTLFEEAPGFGSRDWPESADPFWSRITEE